MKKRIISTTNSLLFLLLLVGVANAGNDRLRTVSLPAHMGEDSFFIFDFAKGVKRYTPANADSEDIFEGQGDIGCAWYADMGELEIASGFAVVLGEKELKELSNRNPGDFIKESEVFLLKFRLKDYILLRTMRGDHALLRIDNVVRIKKRDEEQVIMSWILNPGENKPFLKEDIKLLYDPKPKPDPIIGITTINSLTDDEPTVFSFDKKEVIAFGMHEKDMETEEALLKYQETLQGLGDISYEYFNASGKVMINIASTAFGVIGRGSLCDFGEIDLADKIPQGTKRETCCCFNAEYGTILGFKTHSGKYVLLRIEDISEKGLRFRWICQPDGTAIFPKVGPLPDEKPIPPPNQEELNIQLENLAWDSGKLSDAEVEQEFKRLIQAGAAINDDGYDHASHPLSNAAQKGSIKMANLLIDAGADIDQSKAIFWAIYRGRYDICKLLIDHGADLTCDLNGTSVLQEAIRVKNRNEDIIRLLREHGAGAESIYDMVELGDKEAIRDMVKKGISVNGRGGITPLQFAAQRGDADMCKLLLELGADASLKSEENTVSLKFAVGSGDLDTVKVLLEKASFAEKSKGLLAAISKHNAEMLKMILNSVENPLALIKHDEKMLDFYLVRLIRHDEMKILMENGLEMQLWTAARLGMLEIIDKHIKSGMAIDSLSPKNLSDNTLTPLQLAVEANQVNAAKLLLEYGANPNVIDEPRGHTTPLRWAVEEGNAAMVSLLLSHGAIVGKDLEYDDGLLLRAVVENRYEIVELLLKAGANPNCPPEDKYDTTLLEEAHDAKMKKILKKYGAK